MYIENLDDIEAILDPYEVLNLLIPGVKCRRNSRHLRSKCPVHGGDGEGNFVLDTSTRAWFCHSQGCKGRGLISLYAKSTGMPFKEAIEVLAGMFSVSIQYRSKYGKSESFRKTPYTSTYSPPASIGVKPTSTPLPAWRGRALEFTKQCHQRLLDRPDRMLQLLQERGLTATTIQKFSLGWNEFERHDAINLWGLSAQDLKKPSIWLPKGFVIPTFFDGQVMKLRIRRINLSPQDKPKYVAVTGTRSTPSIYGKPEGMPIFIVESEFDALLIQQEAHDLCCCMTIPAGHHTDEYADQVLRAAPTLIFSFDYEEAVKDRYSLWKNRYPQLKIWMPEKTKSPGDDFKQGVSTRDWVKAGLGYDISGKFKKISL